MLFPLDFIDYQRESPVPGVHLYYQPGDDGSKDPKTRPLILLFLDASQNMRIRPYFLRHHPLQLQNLKQLRC